MLRGFGISAIALAAFALPVFAQEPSSFARGENIDLESNVRTRGVADRDLRGHEKTGMLRQEAKKTAGAFDSVDARAFFESFFKTVHENFAQNAPYADIFRYTLESIEPFSNGFEVTYAGGQMLVHNRNLQLLGNFAKPPADDAKAWADVFVNLLLLLRDQSPTLHGMPQSRLYQIAGVYVLKALDSTSVYFDKDEDGARAARNAHTLGFTWRRIQSGLQVLSILDGSPISSSPISEGDAMTHLNTVPIASMPDEQVEVAIGSDTSPVVGINFVSQMSGRPGEVFLRKNIARFESSKIELAGGIPLLTVFNFNAGAAAEISKRLEAAELSRGLIIDLRATTGGSVDEALELASLIVNGGDLVQSYGSDGSITAYEAKPGDITKGAKIILLASNTTRGAAETFAFALDARGRAVSVGSPTFGEGTERRTFEIHGGRKISFSTRSIYDMSGFPLSGVGMAPLVCQHFLPAVDNLNNFFDRVRLSLFMDNRARIKSPTVRDIQAVRDLCPASYPFTDTLEFGLLLATRILTADKIYDNLLTAAQKARGVEAPSAPTPVAPAIAPVSDPVPLNLGAEIELEEDKDGELETESDE